MPDFQLEAETPLDCYQRSFKDTTLTEVIEQGLVSVAIPQNGLQQLEDAFSKAYSCSLPSIGKSILLGNGSGLAMRLQADQLFILFDYKGDRAVDTVEHSLKDSGYYTDQSDSWVMLRLSGRNALEALERICPLDLHIEEFPTGNVSRTSMEHLGAIILREKEDTFLLLSATSSAHSFLHALEVSVTNVID